jgi:hypothetical protein
MEVIELLVFIGIAVIVGVLVTGFIADWDYKGMYSDVKQLMMPEKETGFEKVDRLEFIGRIQEIFKDCISKGDNETVTLYLNDNGTLSKSDLFGLYKQFGWCETVQSGLNGCGAREDIDMGTITMPKVVQVQCKGTQLVIA